MSQSGSFLASRNDGLGARLIPILSALRLGDEIGVPVHIHWPVIVDMNHNTAEYERLFDAAFIDKHFIDAEAFRRLNAQAVAIETALDATTAELGASVRGGDIYVFANPMRKTRLNTEDADKFSARFSRAFSLISFTSEVRDRMEEIDRAFAGRRCIAYHVRHGDLTRHYRTRGKPWTAKYIPNEIYLSHMEAEPDQGQTVRIVFGDCPQSLDWLKARHCDLLRIGDLVSLDGLGSLQRDFLELYAMSRAGRIIAPRSSGFSQMAAAIGQAQVVDIMEDLNEKQIAEAFGNLARRLRDRRDSFTNDGDVAQSLAHLVPHLAANGDDREARTLIDSEIDAGNTVAFLYQLGADLAYAQKDRVRLAALSRQCRDAMVYERPVAAETDAMAAMLDLEAGETAIAVAALRRGAYLSPFGRNMQAGVSALCDLKNADLTYFYPIDRDLLRLPALTKGRTASGLRAIDMRLFGWEARYFLFGTLTRTLTVSGHARRALKALDSAEAALAGDDDLRFSVQSFRTLIEMEIGDPAQALATSGALWRKRPDHRLTLQRHVLNLRTARNLDEAALRARDLLALAPNMPCYHGLLGDIRLEQRRLDEALEHYEKANPQRALYPVFVLRHAGLLRREKRFDEAEHLLGDALVATGWLDRFILDHVRALLGMRNPVEYLPRLEKLAREGGSMRCMHDLVARIKHRQGDAEEALKYARQAVEYVPENLDYTLFLSHLLAQYGRGAEARSRLAQLPELDRRRADMAAGILARLDAVADGLT